MTMRFGWMFVAAAIAVGCTGTDGEEALTGPAPGDGNWPGGTLGGWDGDGVDERWSRSPTSPDRSSAGGGAMAGSAPAADGAAWDEGATAGAGGGGESWDAPPEGGVEPGPGGGDHSAVPPPPVAPGLEGGRIDDNADLDAFLEFAAEVRERHGNEPMLHWLDVSTRHIITVLDSEGRTVPDADVLITDGEARITRGRTRADGRFAFFPNAYDFSADAYSVDVSTRDGARGAGRIDGDGGLTVTLDEAVDTADRVQLDVVFVVDATGSMGEEIARIKRTITDIALRISDHPAAPDLRLALVDYRDRGDDYVTHAVNFTNDLEGFQQAVNGLQANGGGDGPEALNEALHETMRGLQWRTQDTLRMAFVVADAPAHYYEDAPYTYDLAMLDAAVMGVKLFPIASGGSDDIAELQFRQLAQFTLGHFIFITEGGGSPAGSGGSDYHVDAEDFRVERLDDLVVGVVASELAAWVRDAVPQ